MKTLHFTNSWHGTSGGIGTFYKALFEAANRERQQMRLVVPGETSRVELVGEFGRVYHIESPRAPLYPEYRMLYPYRYLFPRTAVQRILNDERPDLIEVSEKYTTPYLAGLLRTRRLPGVSYRPTVVGLSHERMSESMVAYVSGHPWAQRFCAWYMKAIYFPLFDHHITVSEHTAAELIDASKGHKVRRGIWISPMGVDCDRFTPARQSADARRELLERTGGDSSTTLLFYAGRLAPEKNLGLLLDTMRHLDADYRLAIAGDGIELERLRSAAAHRGLRNVAFLGQVKDRDLLAGYYASADVFVHPNPREPFGIAPLEAMSAGLALVAPNSGGVTSYADETNAWLSRPEGADFADSIRAIRRDPAARKLRTATGRRTAERYSWPNVTSNYLRLYREIHALTQGEQLHLTIKPRSFSTPGDAFGRELIEL